MKRGGVFASLWKRDRQEGYGPILYKILFLLLVSGLLMLLLLERAGIGTERIVARFPALKGVANVSVVEAYLFWLASVWLGFEIGKQVGVRKGAARERKKLGIPF
jgi:hypothetical protein